MSSTSHQSGGPIVAQISASMKDTVHKIEEKLPGHHKDDKVKDVHAANTARQQQDPTHGTTTYTGTEHGAAGARGIDMTAGGTATRTTCTTKQAATGKMEDLSLGAERGSQTGFEEAICDKKTFTKVEDRPVVIERKEYIKEHHPYEKQYRVETKFVGEKEVPTDAPAEVIGAEVRTVETTPPTRTCTAQPTAVPRTATVTHTTTETETVR